MDPKAVQSEDRERAKRVVYSVVYGVGKSDNLYYSLVMVLVPVSFVFFSKFVMNTVFHYKQTKLLLNLSFVCIKGKSGWQIR